MIPSIKHQEKLVREWNEKHPVGTPVIEKENGEIESQICQFCGQELIKKEV